MIGLNAKSLSSIISKSEDRRNTSKEKFDNKNRNRNKGNQKRPQHNSRSTKAQDQKEVVEESEKSALDRIMDGLGAAVEEDFDKDENDTSSEENESVEEFTEESEEESTDDMESEIVDTEVKAETYTVESIPGFTKPRYKITSIGRISISDEFVGSPTFSTTPNMEGHYYVDNDTLGSICTLALLAIESSLTPTIICKKDELIDALRIAGVKEFDRTNFVFVDPNNEYISNLPILGFYVSDKRHTEWNECIDYMLDIEMHNERIVDVLLNIIEYYDDNNFNSTISDSEWSELVNSNVYNDIDSLLEIIGMDSRTKYIDENMEAGEEISEDDIFIEPGAFVDEIYEILGIEESEGVDHAHNPFPGSSNESEKEEGGNTIERYGDGSETSEETREETEPEEEETEATGNDWQEGNIELDGDSLEKEIQESLSEEESAEVSVESN